MKHPNSKLQAPEKYQASKLQLLTPFCNASRAGLDVEVWSFSGAWMLVLGIF